MFTETDYDKLYKIMEESPEKKELLSHLLTSHQITLSTISHEIRNPLTLICSAAELMEKQHPEIINFHYWFTIQNELTYMKSLLDELSLYNNGEHLLVRPISTNTFFKTLALSFASSLIETDIQFISRIEPDLPPIAGDSVKLREVFLNLLKNARDAVSQTANPIIRLSVTSKNSYLEITVFDNGCGISDEHLSDIFQPFITHKQHGTGLGLSIAQRIINSHNGHISVESVLNHHTAFTITLPVQENR